MKTCGYRRAAAFVIAATLALLPVRDATAFLWWEEEARAPSPLDQFIRGEAGRCGSTDLVFAIDKTFSMSTAIREMKREILNIVRVVAHVSAGNYRIGLISVRDDVDVDIDLGAFPSREEALEKLRTVLQIMRAYGGNSGPEASDEAIRTAVEGLGPEGRKQTHSFSGDWQGRSRILVVITDNLPGGFDDEFTEGKDDAHAREVAGLAADRGIRISAIFIPSQDFTLKPDNRAEEIMRNYAQISGGIFAITEEAGRGTAEAIASIIEACGRSHFS